MCLSAAYWARIGRIVFANSRAEAAAIGFCDDELYSELNRHFNERSIVMEHRPLAGSLAPLEHWSGNPARWDTGTPGKPVETTRTANVGTTFKPGDRVVHAKFGPGLVLRSMKQRDDEEVEVFFEEHGGKRLSAALSGLKKT